MPYTKQDVLRRSGLADRTIRNYIARGLLPAPEGYGLGAVYSDEFMLRAVTIGRMRAQGDHVDIVTERIAGWTLAKFRRFVAQTEPKEETAPATAPVPAPAPATATATPTSTSTPTPTSTSTPTSTEPDVDGEPVTPTQTRVRHEPIGDLALPDGPSFQVFPLLPGLGLMLDSRASAIVRRVAAEICERYGQG